MCNLNYIRNLSRIYILHHIHNTINCQYALFPGNIVSSKVTVDKYLPHLVCCTTLAQLMLSDSAAACAPPGPALGPPPSLIVATSTAPSCVYADVSPHPI